jgi:hypothetical protein
MNVFVLVAMDRENYTQEELKKNDDDAFSVYCAEDDNHHHTTTSYAAYSAAYHAYYSAAELEDSLAIYFEITGEDKQNYIDAIEEGK